MKRLRAFLTPHGRYWRYLLRHKWFVLQAGLVLHVPLWRLVIHDWSKFLPSEWIPYVRFFYGPQTQAADFFEQKPLDWDLAIRRAKANSASAFSRAWLHHIHVQPHHWQHWVLLEDDGGTRALMMPAVFVHEMVADWVGAGLAQGRPDVVGWYARNREHMILHQATRLQVETLLTLFRHSTEERERKVAVG